VVSDPAVAAAYARCQRLAREHYENFPVASYLLPLRMRPHVAAIYAFARTADDAADEPGIADADRLRLLDDWSARLERAGSGVHPEPEVDDAGQIFVALSHTIRECRLPISLFRDLLSAFRQDVLQKRYATWDDLLHYCRRSANPVGRLVLRVAGRASPELDARSDDVCTALQLTNFWQDLERDWRIGRVYVPEADRVRAGAREEDLAAGRMTPEWRQVMVEMVQRTRALFAAGRGVCDGVEGRLRWELRLTWLGASRILDRLERSGYDVFHHRPTLGAADAPALVWRAINWSHRNDVHEKGDEGLGL
jgi:squalene synthase HpnC